jgi:predicted metal-dependent hydrolase
VTAPKPTIEAAINLFNRQAFFECHEVLEELWKPLPPGPEKTFLQGLLQVGVGFYHWQRGNPVGARNKLLSGLEKLEVVAAQTQYKPPVPLKALIFDSQLLLNRLLEQHGDSLPDFPVELIPKLE